MRPEFIMASEWAANEVRKRLLRGPLEWWWQVVRGDIEDRAATEMYRMSWNGPGNWFKAAPPPRDWWPR